MLAAVVGPLVAYMTAARKLSGRIGTSEASQLWAESKVLRDDYREQLDATNRRQAKLEERVAQLEAANTELAKENIKLKLEALEAERTIDDLRERVEALEVENTQLKEHIRALEERQAGHGDG